MKFLVDNMLGRLGRWLRLLGIDAKQVKRNSTYDEIIFTSLNERRILLTRSKKISKHRVYGIYYVKNEDLRKQLKEVIENFNIKIDEDKIFSRCIICNEELKRIEKEKVKGEVPNYVYQTRDEFYTCPSCKKIFWEGTHFELALQFIKKELLK
ncbi:MAG: hypothetical protein DRI36_06410 [Caldiserica bacterium]|nr:MAG: hypothetical protein DRI36_06410 [Caldisericota bacterium]